MKDRTPTELELPPEIKHAGRVLLCIGIAAAFGALAAIAAFVVGFLLMGAQGDNRTGPLLMVLGTPAAFVVGAWLAWRWARRTVTPRDDR